MFAHDEFDCPEVTLCEWQDVKIQLLSGDAGTSSSSTMQSDDESYQHVCMLIAFWTLHQNLKNGGTTC